MLCKQLISKSNIYLQCQGHILVINITLIFSELSCRLCSLEDFHDSAWCPFLSDISALMLKAEFDC